MSEPAAVYGLPDLDEPTPKRSLLDELEADVTAETGRDPITIRVRPRRLTALRFSGDLDYAQLETWQRRSTKKWGTPQAQVDSLMLASLVIANQCEAVVDARTGEDVFGSDGRVLNFKHPEWLTMLKAADYLGAIDNLWGKDKPHILITMNEVLQNGGYSLDGSEEVLNPTRAAGS